MRRRISLFLVLCAALLGLGFYKSKQISAPSVLPGVGLFQDLAKQLPAYQELPEPLQKVEDVVQDKKPAQALSAQKVIVLTNQERAKLDRKALKEDARLTKAAEHKLDDMFTNQYFEHMSPTGKGPADVISATGYTYILVGENLAEGDFRSSEELVLGWMNSPGHRANIINAKYTQIGVAVKKGRYQGELVWMAVQEFGRPLSDCPEVDGTIKGRIAENEARIKVSQELLHQLSTEMSAAQNDDRIEDYNNLVPKYNAIVAQVDAVITQTKLLVTQYNEQVQKFNSCIK